MFKELLETGTCRGTCSAVLDHLLNLERMLVEEHDTGALGVDTSLAGHGFCAESALLQEALPPWSCIKPGFATSKDVVGTLTQPLDSCITTARMNRLSTLVLLDTS